MALNHQGVYVVVDYKLGIMETRFAELIWNREPITSVRQQQAGNTGSIVGGIGLKAAAAQSIRKRLTTEQAVAYGIGLIAVGDDRPLFNHTNGVIDDQRGILYFILIIGFGPDPVFRLLKDAVAAVFAAAHNEVCKNRFSVVRRAS